MDIIIPKSLATNFLLSQFNSGFAPGELLLESIMMTNCNIGEKVLSTRHCAFRGEFVSCYVVTSTVLCTRLESSILRIVRIGLFTCIIPGGGGIDDKTQYWFDPK